MVVNCVPKLYYQYDVRKQIYLINIVIVAYLDNIYVYSNTVV